MFFNRRKKYNGKVSALLPAFGFDLEEAGVMKTLNVLDIAWQQKYNEYEGALYVSYLVVSGYLKRDKNKALEILDQTKFVQQDWLSKGLVDQALVQRFTEKANEWLGIDNDTENKGFEFTPNMPDIMSAQPVVMQEYDETILIQVENVPSLFKKFGGEGEHPLFYLQVAALISKTTNKPIAIFTLETGMTDANFFGLFEGTGKHLNLGKQDRELSRQDFLELAKEKLGLSVTTP
ncbi:hypothetical protein EJ063_19590 [Vibrio aquaticus]|uniref:Uncharacterized protein n=1 Tax=Vibrio aquaticus TaxID=2496559 RepID=A0A3S0P3N4_9VIBR|nr:hypothetical protein [Vibrio aquaticus]RTZ13611.1 hypothetical protein EJ063_19590 [Vibrio aquaticus]